MSGWLWIDDVDKSNVRYFGVKLDEQRRVLSVERAADYSTWPRPAVSVDLARVQRASDAAFARAHSRRSEAAKRAAQTRKKRQGRRVYEIVAALKAGRKLTSTTTCRCCGKGLDDPESISRGIGSDCWQVIMRALTTPHAGTAP